MQSDTARITGGSDSMGQLVKRLWKEEEGQDLTEYALLVVLIALAAVTAMQGLASAVVQVFSNAAANITSVTQ